MASGPLRHGNCCNRRPTPEYVVWAGIIQRCTDPGCGSYQRYGGRGITVCDRWRNSFENFLADMGPRPGLEYSIDRINNGGNYEPGNCRWATREEQRSNTRRNRVIEWNGVRRTLAQWERSLGMRRGTLQARLDQHHWSLERALTTPVDSDVPIEFQGISRSVREWERVLGFRRNCVRARLGRGWTIERALTTPSRRQGGGMTS